VANSLEEAKGLCNECSAKEQITASLDPKEAGSIQDAGSGIESPAYETESDESYSRSDPSEANFFADIMTSIATDLLGVLGHDMTLLARLLPQIHASLQARLCDENTSYAGSDYNTGGDSMGECGSLASSKTRKSSTSSSLGKRGRNERKQDDDGDDDDDGENERPKKPREKYEPNENRGLRYACPFHKRWPDIYTNLEGTKYRSCSGPGQTEVRRLK
jgi:hypothetical protein